MLESIAIDQNFCPDDNSQQRSAVHWYTQKPIRQHLEDQGMQFFRQLVKIYGKDVVRPRLSFIDQTFRFHGAGATPVHKAVESGHFRLVNTVFIDEIGFDPDFYT